MCPQPQWEPKADVANSGLGKAPGTNLRTAYLSEEPIGAIATPLGGALSVIRVSGENVFEKICDRLKFNGSDKPRAREFVRAKFLDQSGGIIDDLMVVWFEQGRSFTGEESVEMTIHGSSVVATRIMEELDQAGIRQALPGEFSFRAVRNGKMSITQAQAIPELIESKSKRAADLALEKLSGTQNRQLAELDKRLMHIISRAELGIDFSDQEVDELALEKLQFELRPVLQTLNRLHASYDRGQRIQKGLKVVMVGLPNAGKSSLFNAILGEDLSIVSAVEGTTRDIVREEIELRSERSGVHFRFEDTAGLRDSNEEVEKLGIERTMKAACSADIVIWVVDPTQNVEASFQMVRRIQELRVTSGITKAKILGVLTKADLVDDSGSVGKMDSDFQKYEDVESWGRTSAVNGDGIEMFQKELVRVSEKLTSRETNEVLITRLDHLHAVGRAIESLERAREAETHDLFAADLRLALYSLAPLIGENVPDDILGKIFSEFCIGK